MMSSLRMQRFLITGCAVLVLCANPAWALSINPTYIDGAGQSWDAVGSSSANGRLAFDAAIATWESLILDAITVDVDVTFDDLGSTGPAGIWSGDVNVGCGGVGQPACGTQIDVEGPHSQFITHTITFNSENIGSVFFDTSPDDASNLPFVETDAFSVALHEIGHMMGFSDIYTLDVFGDFGGPFKPWSDQIDETTNIFDPSELNVQMETNGGAFFDVGHIQQLSPSPGCGSALMAPVICNGERRNVSQLELDMLALAHGYNVSVIPLPPALPSMLFAIGGLGALLRRGKAV